MLYFLTFMLCHYIKLDSVIYVHVHVHFVYIYIYIFFLYFIYAFIINSVGEHIKIMGSVCYSYNLIIVFKRVFMNTS